ncbi:MAG: hypothetical protein HN482_14390, partial [Bdellovibrionales bacterium]|nr:hypothetical protein [Bdellovibrionales bacterium]
SVTATGPISSSGGATPDISIAQADGATSGYLSGTDWTTFNDKGDLKSDGSVPMTANFRTGSNWLSNDGTNSGIFIATSGAVGIGTSTDLAYALTVSGNLMVKGSAATACVIGDGTGTTACSSDKRLKKEVKPIANAVDKIMKLRGVEYVWNDLSGVPGKKAIGVIAQEVKKVFPTLVMENPNGYLMVAYDGLVGPLIQATKEQQHSINHLRYQIDEIFNVLYEAINNNSLEIAENQRDIASLEEQNKKLEAEVNDLKAENKLIKDFLCKQNPAALFCQAK